MKMCKECDQEVVNKARCREHYNLYMKEYMKQRRIKRRVQMIEKLGGECVRCHSTERLEFNHRDPKEKEFNILQIWDSSWEKIYAELDKCELLCHDCHLDHTAESWASGIHVPWNKGKEDEWSHGSARGYHSSSMCRCDLCKHANSLYRKGVIDYDTVVS